MTGQRTGSRESGATRLTKARRRCRTMNNLSLPCCASGSCRGSARTDNDARAVGEYLAERLDRHRYRHRRHSVSDSWAQSRQDCRLPMRVGDHPRNREGSCGTRASMKPATWRRRRDDGHGDREARARRAINVYDDAPVAAYRARQHANRRHRRRAVPWDAVVPGRAMRLRGRRARWRANGRGGWPRGRTMRGGRQRRRRHRGRRGRMGQEWSKR